MMTPEELDQIRTLIREEVTTIIREEVATLIAPLDQKVEAVKQDVGGVRQHLLDFRTEVIQRFEYLEQQLDTQSGLLGTVKMELATMTTSALKTESALRRLNTQLADHEARLRNLEGAA